MPFPTSPRHLSYSCLASTLHCPISTIFPYGVAGTIHKPLLILSWTFCSFPRRGWDLWPHRGTVPCFHPLKDFWSFASLCSGKRPLLLGTNPSRQRYHMMNPGAPSLLCSREPPVCSQRGAASSAYCSAKDLFQSLIKKKTPNVDTEWL